MIPALGLLRLLLETLGPGWHRLLIWWSVLVGLAAMVLVNLACGSAQGQPSNSRIAARYVSVFEATRKPMLSAVAEWNNCGEVAADCRGSLARIEVLTTSFGSLYWDVAQGRQSPVPVPSCLSAANGEVLTAVAAYRAGTANGFRVYDDRDVRLLPMVRASISSGTEHLQTAEALIVSASCGKLTGVAQSSGGLVFGGF